MRKLDTARESEGTRTPEQAFGANLRRMRLKRGLSQQGLADKSGYHRTYIGLLERGQKSPSLRTIWNIAIVLQAKPSEMLKRVERLVGRAEGQEKWGSSPDPRRRH